MGRVLPMQRTHRSSLPKSIVIAALVSAVATVSFVGVTAAGANPPTQGSQVLGAAAAVSPFTTGIPFASGQNINVVVPANSVFNSTTGIQIAECTAPNNVIPTDPAACDGSTVNGPSLFPNADGSVDYHAFTGQDYPVYALPDSISLGEAPGGPACSLTVPCILFIGVNYNDFTSPHVWSQFFFVQPASGDNGQPAGDGSAPAVGTVASAVKSTISAAPTTSTANNNAQSTVTVTLLTSGGVPVPAKSVTLSQGTGHSVIQPATAGSNVTDVNGVATFSVTDATAESVTYGATDTTDNVTINATVAVNFQAPVVTDAHSSVTAASPQVAISPATDQITVTLRDQAPLAQPIANKSITLSGTGTAVVTPAAVPNLTNSQGVATFQVSDPTAEVATFTAKDVTDNLTLSQTVQVTFGTLVVSPGSSTLTASPTAAVGGLGGSATVTLLTSTQSAVAGKQVSLSVTGSAVVGSNLVTTNASGQASFNITDANPETVTVTAKDVSDGNTTVASPATITFELPAPSATGSTLTAQPSTGPADGLTAITVIATIKDQFGHPLQNKNVTLANSTGANAQCPPQASSSFPPGITDASGAAEFLCNDTVAEVVTFSAIDVTDSFIVQQTATVTYTAGVANADVSTVTSSNSGQSPSDGTTPSVITVTLNDFFGNRVTGKTISLTALNGNSHLTTINGVTDQNGQAVFNAVDSTQEVVTYAAKDTTDNLPLTAQGVVRFGNPQAPPPVIAFSDVAASPSSVVANGTATSMITVTLSDGNGNYVPGKDVTLAAAGGTSKIAAVSATTGNTGTAMFTVSDPTAETVTLTATDTTDNIVLKGDEVVVTFTTPTASSTTTTTTTPTNGSSSSATSVSTGLSPAASGSGSGGTLAATGPAPLVPWLIGFGVFLFTLGALERRRLLLRRTQ
jgi:adhesin/invasin